MKKKANQVHLAECSREPEISFEPLNEKHFSLIHGWFNKPHVQTFYSLRAWTIEEVRHKLTPYKSD